MRQILYSIELDFIGPTIVLSEVWATDLGFDENMLDGNDFCYELLCNWVAGGVGIDR